MNGARSDRGQNRSELPREEVSWTSEHKYEWSGEGRRRVFQAENCMGKGLKAKMSKAELQVASERNPTRWLKLNWNILVHSEAQREECLTSSTRISFPLLVSSMDSSPQVVVATTSETTQSPGIQPDWPGQVTCPSLNECLCSGRSLLIGQVPQHQPLIESL